jgi:hypothetical protein
MKFGKKAAIPTPRRMRAMLALGTHLAALGSPPAATNNRAAVRAKLGPQWYQMYGNDRYGDCVWVDSGNAVPLLLANAGRPIIVPTESDVLKGYSDVTYFSEGPPVINDDGTDENAAIAYLRSTGIVGQKIDDSAPIDPTQIDNIKWAIALFMRLRSGICVGADYIQAFESRQPWTTAMPPGRDGHDVAFLDYDPNGVYAGTWARDDQFIPWDKVLQPGFVDELHAELWFDLIRAAGTAPDGLSLDVLDADLKYIGPEEDRYLTNISTKPDYGAIEAARHGVVRSSHWETVEKDFKVKHPNCIAGGRGPIQVHHINPFHYVVSLGRPDLELDHRNLVGLTEGPDEAVDGEYHLLLGHHDNFKLGILSVREDSSNRFHGMSCADIRNDPFWQSIEPLKALDEMTSVEKRAFRTRLDTELPPDHSADGPIARWPECKPTPLPE